MLQFRVSRRLQARRGLRFFGFGAGSLPLPVLSGLGWRRLRCRGFVNGLPELLQLLVGFDLGARHRVLRGVNGVGQQVAALADAL